VSRPRRLESSPILTLNYPCYDTENVHGIVLQNLVIVRETSKVQNLVIVRETSKVQNLVDE
jgi:hypothetical protein